jgi:hypothetical protein
MKTLEDLRFSVLLLVPMFCFLVCAGQAQENAQSPVPPAGTAAVPTCSKIPSHEEVSDDFNKGYRTGFKDGCNAAASTKRTIQPRASVDEAIGDTPAPFQYKEENQKLLDALKSMCPPAAKHALQEGSDESNSWNLKYRISLLTALVKGAECSNE